MSATDSSPSKHELSQEALAYFDGVFPEDIVIRAGTFGPERDARLAKAGLGLAEIVFQTVLSMSLRMFVKTPQLLPI